MRNLGHKVSRQTVKNVLKEAGLGPDPVDHPDTWSDFLRRHAVVMWQCDFACKRKWMSMGMVDLYFLVFIHIETQRIWVSPCTANPAGDWTTQQARKFAMHVEEQGLRCEIVSNKQLHHTLAQGADWYNNRHCHSERDNRPQYATKLNRKSSIWRHVKLNALKNWVGN